nr:MAG TPA: hypothetical protein [Microviridae sp.]
MIFKKFYILSRFLLRKRFPLTILDDIGYMRILPFL